MEKIQNKNASNYKQIKFYLKKKIHSIELLQYRKSKNNLHYFLGINNKLNIQISLVLNFVTVVYIHEKKYFCS